MNKAKYFLESYVEIPATNLSITGLDCSGALGTLEASKISFTGKVLCKIRHSLPQFVYSRRTSLESCFFPCVKRAE